MISSILIVPFQNNINFYTFIRIIKSFPEYKSNGNDEKTIRVTLGDVFFNFGYFELDSIAEVEHRNIQIHHGQNGFEIILNAFGNDEEILRRIANRLGGFLSLKDSNSWERIETMTKGNIEFCLQDAINNGVFDNINDSSNQLNKFVECSKKYT